MLAESSPPPTAKLELRTAKGWRIFAYIACSIFIAVFVSLIIMTLFNQPGHWATWAIIVPACLGMIGFSIYSLIEAHTGVYTFDATGVAYDSRLMHQRLAHDDVRGFRTDEYYVYIIPFDKTKKTIKVGFSTERYAEILKFINTAYEPLPDVDPHEVDEVLSNEEHGTNPWERIKSLTHARKVARAVNIVGCVAAAWALKPIPYEATMITAIVTVIAALSVLFWFRGFIRIDTRKTSAYPSITYGMTFPAVMLMLRCLFDYDVEDALLLVRYAFIGGIVLVALCAYATREYSFKRWTDYLSVITLTFVMSAYTYGATTFLNCYYDDSTAQSHVAQVLDKHITSGKTTTYYLKLSSWGPRHEAEDVSVSRAEYERINIRDSVEILLHDGKLGARWFYLK